MRITAAYIRVSTYDQENGIKSQEKAVRDYIRNHGIQNVKWYHDRVSGATTERPALRTLQKDIFLGKVDTVVCWKLDRLSRSMKDGINVLTEWCDKGIHIVAVSQQIDFNGTVGRLIASVLLAVAEMERQNISENVKRGMAAAKERGVKLGKRPSLFAKDVVPLQATGMTITQIAEKLGKSRQAIYDALSRG
ncbi:MAG: DNA-invertase hin [Planctomycetes bacterium ADurb.Bin412]|nr:MAG: DNA-invertase hin [Planctomycetes bacterium ADurb.Bin412]